MSGIMIVLKKKQMNFWNKHSVCKNWVYMAQQLSLSACVTCEYNILQDISDSLAIFQIFLLKRCMQKYLWSSAACKMELHLLPSQIAPLQMQDDPGLLDLTLDFSFVDNFHILKHSRQYASIFFGTNLLFINILECGNIL